MAVPRAAPPPSPAAPTRIVRVTRGLPQPSPMVRGRLVAAGSHDELLAGSPHYRRIFARYDLPLPAPAAAPGAS